MDNVALDPPKSFTDAKKVHSSILGQKVVYNPTLPKDRDKILGEIKARLVKRLNSTVQLKSHWTSTRPPFQPEIPMPTRTSPRHKRKNLATKSDRARKKKKSKTTAVSAAAADAVSTAEGVAKTKPQQSQWVQCDNTYCRKWRKMNPEAGPLPDKWFCVMNTWNPHKASCSMPETDTEQS